MFVVRINQVSNVHGKLNLYTSKGCRMFQSHTNAQFSTSSCDVKLLKEYLVKKAKLCGSWREKHTTLRGRLQRLTRSQKARALDYGAS